MEVRQKSFLRDLIDPDIVINITVGNPSADADSIEGAMILAKVLEKEYQEVCQAKVARGEEPSPKRHVFYPMNMIKKDILKTRKEQAWLFEKKFGLGEDKLFFLEHILLLRQAYDEKRVRVHLFDGNSLPSYLEMFAGAVKTITDHHADEGKYTDDETVVKQFSDVGSCTSLLVERLLKDPDLDSSWLKLAFVPIALDTSFFDKKMKPIDTKAKDLIFEKLEGFGYNELNLEDFYKLLLEARNNIDGLTLEELLHKDEKSWCLSGLEVSVATILGNSHTHWDSDPKHVAALQEVRVYGSHPMGLSQSKFFMTGALAGKMVDGNFTRFFQVSFASPEFRDLFVAHMKDDPAVESYSVSSEFPTASFTLPAWCSRKKILEKLIEVMPRVAHAIAEDL